MPSAGWPRGGEPTGPGPLSRSAARAHGERIHTRPAAAGTWVGDGKQRRARRKGLAERDCGPQAQRPAPSEPSVTLISIRKLPQRPEAGARAPVALPPTPVFSAPSGHPSSEPQECALIFDGSDKMWCQMLSRLRPVSSLCVEWKDRAG